MKLFSKNFLNQGLLFIFTSVSINAQALTFDEAEVGMSVFDVQDSLVSSIGTIESKTKGRLWYDDVVKIKLPDGSIVELENIDETDLNSYKSDGCLPGNDTQCVSDKTIVMKLSQYDSFLGFRNAEIIGLVGTKVIAKNLDSKDGALFLGYPVLSTTHGECGTGPLCIGDDVLVEGYDKKATIVATFKAHSCTNGWAIGGYAIKTNNGTLELVSPDCKMIGKIPNDNMLANNESLTHGDLVYRSRVEYGGFNNPPKYYTAKANVVISAGILAKLQYQQNDRATEVVGRESLAVPRGCLPDGGPCVDQKVFIKPMRKVGTVIAVYPKDSLIINFPEDNNEELFSFSLDNIMLTGSEDCTLNNELCAEQIVVEKLSGRTAKVIAVIGSEIAVQFEGEEDIGLNWTESDFMLKK
ncbi:MAG: hypothetical protein HOO06_04245 [Bdellovibrionaceae bacterium]|jgi:hypothetical protein|nr:hypothetical protein [Pseudobdellovibrionaceae bacterium]